MVTPEATENGTTRFFTVTQRFPIPWGDIWTNDLEEMNRMILESALELVLSARAFETYIGTGMSDWVSRGYGRSRRRTRRENSW